MFWKLVKHEFKSIGKWYLSLYGVALGLSIILGIMLRSLLSKDSTKAAEFTIPNESLGWPFAIAFIICLIGLMLVLAAVGISTIILIIRRFATNLYGREGYLTNTLPVNQHQLIFSKLLTAFSWSLLSSITVFLSTILVWLISDHTDGIGIKEIITNLTNTHINFLMLFLVLVFIVVSFVNVILTYYLSISIGNLFKNYKVLMGFVSYFVVTILVHFISAWISNILKIQDFTKLTTTTDFYAYFLTSIIFNLICSVFYYFGTHYILKKHLNLD